MSTQGAIARPPVRSLREEVYEHLRTLMSSGQLRPGEFLNLNSLTEEIGISRTPLRDALLRLESEGFVEILNRRGVRVTELTLESIRDIYEILGGLESSALRSVANRMTPEIVAHMAELNERMAWARDHADFDGFYDANLEFHDAYLSLSTNARLASWIHILRHRLYDFPRSDTVIQEWLATSVDEHAEFLALLRAGKVVEGADYLRDVHWSFTRQEPYIRRYYGVPKTDGSAA